MKTFKNKSVTRSSFAVSSSFKRLTVSQFHSFIELRNCYPGETALSLRATKVSAEQFHSSPPYGGRAHGRTRPQGRMGARVQARAYMDEQKLRQKPKRKQYGKTN